MAYTSEIEKLERRWNENPQGTSFAPLAEAYRKDGQVERGRDLLRLGLANHPQHIPASIVLGRCCLDLKADGEAEEAFLRVLELDRENVIALKALADVTERHGRLAEAEQWLVQLISVDPSNDDAREQQQRVSEMREHASLRLYTSPTLEVTAQETPAATPSVPEPVPLEELSPIGRAIAGREEDEEDTVVVEAVHVPSTAPAEPTRRPTPLELPIEEIETLTMVPALQAAPVTPPSPPTPVPPPPPEAVTLEPEAVPTFLVEVEDDPLLTALPGMGLGSTGGTVPPLDGGVELQDDIVLQAGSSSSEFQTPNDADTLRGGRTSEEFSGATLQRSAPEPASGLPLIFPEEIEPPLVPVAARAAPPLAAPAPPAEKSAAEARIGEPEPVVTATMAELYVEQGHVGQAIQVYRALLTRNPGDARLRGRLAELEREAEPQPAVVTHRQPAELAEPAGAGESVETFFRRILSRRPTSVSMSAMVSDPVASPPSGEGQGAPTRPAQDPLSLSAIFGEDVPPVPTATPPGSDAASPAGSREGSSLDQFFGNQPGSP
ncbi:MAG: tetratricopeptide repeat protein, partial [Gemmatimonadales bacterium]